MGRSAALLTQQPIAKAWRGFALAHESRGMTRSNRMRVRDVSCRTDLLYPTNSARLLLVVQRAKKAVLVLAGADPSLFRGVFRLSPI